MLRKSGGSRIYSKKMAKKLWKIRSVPAPYCQLFEIHGGIFKPHPVRCPGQTSMVCITHRVFLFRIRKDTFDRFLAHGIKLFPSLRPTKLFGIGQTMTSQSVNTTAEFYSVDAEDPNYDDLTFGIYYCLKVSFPKTRNISQYYSGLRKGELLGLTWNCVDFERGTITVKQQLKKCKKRAGGMLLLPRTENSV